MTEQIADLVAAGGYLAIGTIMVVECVFPPIPSEAALLLTGVAVGEGTLTFTGALIAATVGSLIGALVLYAAGWYGGRPLVARYGGALGVRAGDLDRAERWFDRYGAWVVLTGRMVPLVRNLVSVPAGLTRMRLIRFVALTAIGSAAWNAAIISAGWFVGDGWERVAESLGRAAATTGAVMTVALVVAALWWRRRRAAPS